MSAIRTSHPIQDIVNFVNDDSSELDFLDDNKISDNSKTKALNLLLKVSIKLPSNNKFRRRVEKEILKPTKNGHIPLLNILKSI